jgi:hypothetical protein
MPEPKWLLATTGPCRMRRVRISELRMNVGIRTRLRCLFRSSFDLFEPLFELELLGLHSRRPNRGDLLMKCHRSSMESALKSIFLSRDARLAFHVTHQNTKKAAREKATFLVHRIAWKLSQAEPALAATPVRHEADPAEANNHHGPGGGLGNRRSHAARESGVCKGALCLVTA